MELREAEKQVLYFVGDNTSAESQFYLNTDDSVQFTEMKVVLGLHQEKLKRVLKSLTADKLVEKSTLPKFLATLSKRALKRFEKHISSKVHRSNKRFYFLTPKGEKLYKEIQNNLPCTTL